MDNGRERAGSLVSTYYLLIPLPIYFCTFAFWTKARDTLIKRAVGFAPELVGKNTELDPDSKLELEPEPEPER